MNVMSSQTRPSMTALRLEAAQRYCQQSLWIFPLALALYLYVPHAQRLVALLASEQYPLGLGFALLTLALLYCLSFFRLSWRAVASSLIAASLAWRVKENAPLVIAGLYALATVFYTLRARTTLTLLGSLMVVGALTYFGRLGIGFAAHSAEHSHFLVQLWLYAVLAISGLSTLLWCAKAIARRHRQRDGGHAPIALASPAIEAATPPPPALSATSAEATRKAASAYRFKAESVHERMSSILGMDDTKAVLVSAATRMIAPGAAENGILLHGKPGNGKSAFARAVAGELGVPMVTTSVGHTTSKWVGESTQNVMQLIAEAKAQAPCVLFIDEIDALLPMRSDAAIHHEDRKQVSTLLTELVALRGHQVLLMGATNYFDTMDTAALREGRFDLKLEIPNPDRAARRALLAKGLTNSNPHLLVSEVLLDWLADRYEGFSTSRILRIALGVGNNAHQTQQPEATYNDFALSLKQSQAARQVDPCALGLDDVVMPEPQRAELTRVANAMAQPYSFSKAGGSAFSGLLFEGPPGTGKTLVARALAKDAGWNVVECSGSDLLMDLKKIDEVIDRAIDQKPCVLFIDEAESLLRSRALSDNGVAITKFLQRTGSASSGLADVLMIAATNVPEHIDDAALRGGRFEKRIRFEFPDAAAVAGHLKKLIRTYPGEHALDFDALADTLLGRSISDIELITKDAKNVAAERAIASGVTPRLSQEDFAQTLEKMQVLRSM
jgi:transitional endoplasmic reticulum ATPase